MAEHSALPWTWHAKSIDQAHNGSIYRMERPGHAYAVAMQPRYVDDKEFAANAAFIVKAVNNHEALVKALSDVLNKHAGLGVSPEIVQAKAVLQAAVGKAQETGGDNA